MLCAGHNYTKNLEILQYVHYLLLLSSNNVIKKQTKTKTLLNNLDFFEEVVPVCPFCHITYSSRNFISTVFNFLFAYLILYKSEFYSQHPKEYPKDLSKDVEQYLFTL